MPATGPASAKAFYPGNPVIDAYGNGGFRFADMSHRGSILIVPGGVHGWNVTAADALSTRDFAPIFSEIDDIEHILLGMGEFMMAPPETLQAACRARGVSVEAMTTGAAVRTYNVMIAERRKVAAGLIAVSAA